jgi:MFS family permease
MLFLIMTFGINFPVFVSAMAVNVFNAQSHEFGVLSSMLAIGSVSGALFAAHREKPRASFLFASAFVFGVGLVVAALMPTYMLFGMSLVLVGLAAQTFNTTANSSVQLWTEPAMRGRVMAIYMAIAMGCTPLGAPLVGWVADHFGPRWSLAVGAASGFAATFVGIAYLARYRGLRIRIVQGRPRLQMSGKDVARGRAEVRATEAMEKP